MNLAEKYDYQTLKQENFFAQYIKPLLRHGFHLDINAKVSGHKMLATETPWIFAKNDQNRFCDVWHRMYFNILGMLPSACLQCWKVVVRPQNLVDLFKLREIQIGLDYPSKCGMEIRNTVFGNYGGYFYNDHYEEGIICYEKVKKAVAEHIGENTPVIFKRGCTEFEHHFGDSKDWDSIVTPQQLEIENALEEVIPHEVNPGQPDWLKQDILQRLVEFAFERGDSTYKEFMNGENMFDPYRTFGDGQVRPGTMFVKDNVFANTAFFVAEGVDQ
mgnify:CR=1 FL=1